MISSGILTQLLGDITGICATGLSLIKGDAMSLLAKLVALDLSLTILMNLEDQDHLKTLVEKTMKYGFFIYLVSDWGHILSWVLDGFVYIGLKAGGNTISAAKFADPSAIAEYGLNVVFPIFNSLKNISSFDIGAVFTYMATCGVAGILVVLCFFVIGIQIFIVYLEFYIVSMLALILVPFGANKYTAFLGEKALGGVIAFGIKLMVLAFIASIAMPLVKTWTLPQDPQFAECMRLLLGSLALASLAWMAPSLASGLLAGSPSLTAGAAAGVAAAGVAGGVAGAMGIQKMAEGAQAMRKAASSLGDVSSKLGGGSLDTGGSTDTGSSSGPSPGGSAPSSSSSSDRGASSGPSSGGSPKSSASNMVNRLGNMKNAMPPEPQPGAGASPNLSK